MCDEPLFEPGEPDPFALSRRQLAIGSAMAAFTAATGSAATAAGKALVVRERAVIVPTPDGQADAVLFHPAAGRHPAVVMWPDIAGIRDANRAMARRLATAGYAVLLVNQYYRTARAPVLSSFAEWRTPAGQERLRPMIAALNADGITRDGAAFVAWLDRQRGVDTRRGAATIGYCMGGPFAVRTAVAAPGRVALVGSFHGGGLVTDKPDSPHALLGKTRADYLIAVARNDDARAPGDKQAFKAAADAAERFAEIEVYAADHGWTVPDSPVYDQAEAERAWARLLAMAARL